MVAVTRILLCLLVVLPCQAFANARHVSSRLSASGASSRHGKTAHQQPSFLPKLRGGSTTSLDGTSDYSEAARVLFDNMNSPAALLASGLVPLGFLADPLPGDKPINKRLRCIYNLLSVFSLSNELLTIVYATVASNKLAETVAAPASSVFGLIQRDYELQWIATNVHFMFGLFGFLAIVGLRAYTIFPKKLNSATAGIAGSALLAMCSVVNRGVEAGDDRGRRFGGNIVSMVARYVVLLVQHLKRSGGVLAACSILLGLFSTALAVRALFSSETE